MAFRTNFLSRLALATGLFVPLLTCGQAPAKSAQPPAWAQSVVWYQIFVERFANGDPKNDPTPATMGSASTSWPVPADWSITPWTQNWYTQEPWAKQRTDKRFNEALEYRRYGGDLQGVLDKLDYLRELGVTALYLNPINDAPSYHKYDARNYHHIDVNFGPDPAGDQKIIAAENPGDPKTWKWTAADRLFLKLIQEAHKRQMKVVIDYSWNHTGVEFWAWRDLVKNQERSVYKDWYEIKAFDNPATPENEFAYKGWADVSSLPELKKINVPGQRVSGYPFEGNLNEGAKAHVFAVSKRWLAPDGDTTRGADGYRLDVADQIPMGFWRDYHAYVKAVKPSAYLVGEIWWEKWPNRLMNPAPYCQGDVFDAVMFYQMYRPARSFFGAVNDSITARQFADSLNFQWNRLGEPFRYAMMNVSATHDAPRLLSCFDNPGKYKYNASPSADPNYRSGKPSADAYRRARLYLLYEFTTVGAPHIWNGDEMGMWGGDDPDCRKPLWWPNLKFEPETSLNPKPDQKPDPVGFNQAHYDTYKLLAHLRRENPVLATGKLEFVDTGAPKTLLYKRSDGKQTVYVAFNLSHRPASVTLPEGTAFTNLLDRTRLKGRTVALAPLAGIVLAKQ